MAERERIGPGVYAVGDELHVDAVEMCRYMGVPPTAANQEVAVKVANVMAVEAGIPFVECER